jgi:superfamily I DNA/RNA helicase
MELLEEELALGTRPDKIAFLTFTRAAREEALQRTGRTEADFPYLRTIHAICYRQLGITQDQIVKPHDLRTFGKFLGVKLNGNTTDPWVEEFERTFDPPTRDDFLLQANHCGRHRGILLKEALQEISLDVDFKYAVWFTKAYRNWKNMEGMLDYTDLLTQYLDNGKPLDIDTIFVDEAQDLSSLQWEVVSKLGANAQRWFIAGDDDQAIFHWAGADATAFQDLKVDMVETLDQSYRVSKAVHKAAMKVVGRIGTRLTKEYAPTESDGEVADIGYLRTHEFKDKTFVLFRNHYRGQELARQLKEESVPFIGHGSPLYDAGVRTALLSWYKLIKNKEIPQAAARKVVKYCDPGFLHLNIKKRITSQKTFKIEDVFINRPQWHEWSRIMHNLPGKDYLESCARRVGFLNTARPNTELLSIHQSKGREAQTVIIDTEISRAVYDNLLTNPDDEHRVWYVGVTRAKEKLMFLLPDGTYSYRV